MGIYMILYIIMDIDMCLCAAHITCYQTIRKFMYIINANYKLLPSFLGSKVREWDQGNPRKRIFMVFIIFYYFKKLLSKHGNILLNMSRSV